MAQAVEPGIVRVPLSRVTEIVSGAVPVFPKYTAQLINLANQTAQGTRPRVVGQVTDLIVECPEKTLEGWVRWYGERRPDAVRTATDKIWAQVLRYRDAANLITRDMVEDWVRDLLVKTFVGLRTQEVVLEVLGDTLNLGPLRRATPADESRGIDGYLGDQPVSVKPETYRAKILSERIDVPIVYYAKDKSSLIIDARELLAGPRG